MMMMPPPGVQVSGYSNQQPMFYQQQQQPIMTYVIAPPVQQQPLNPQQLMMNNPTAPPSAVVPMSVSEKPVTPIQPQPMKRNVEVESTIATVHSKDTADPVPNSIPADVENPIKPSAPVTASIVAVVEEKQASLIDIQPADDTKKPLSSVATTA